MKQRNYMLSLIILLCIMFLTACNNSLDPGLHIIGNNSFYEILNSDSEEGYFVYIGRPTCDLCRQMEPNIEQTLQELSMPMYYFQTALARTEEDYGGEARMLELLAPLNIDGIPIIVHLINGEVASYLIGVHDQSVITTFLGYEYESDNED